jgi:UDP-N-acetylmuramate--alanine ligase
LLGKTRRIHFVGIGGSGMCGIAELLANLGYIVTGSDEKRSAVTDRLATLGVRVDPGHAAAHVAGADVVVVSSAVRPTNVEVVEAARLHIPVIPRAEMLAELMRLRYAIAVAGAHGKTTTTSMIAYVLERAGLDPTAVIGGRFSAFGSNARLGRGELMVAEADESDRSFLKLFPTIAVITNIDREHLENYGSFADLQQAFVDFANKVPFYGSVVCSSDNAPLREVIPRMTRRVITYGIDAESAHLRASDVVLRPFGATATVVRRISDGERAATATLGSLTLNVPGRHNLSNALACTAVGLELGLSFDQIATGLADFRGAERRFEVRGEPRGILVIDDYGHHPTEIAAVIAAARTLGRRIIVAFQPHRFSRTASLKSAFGPSLADADHVVLTDIYAAGEDPVPGVTLESLAAAIRDRTRRPVDVVPMLRDVAPALAQLAQPGDVVITLGAGSIGTVAEPLIELLSRADSRPADAKERT